MLAPAFPAAPAIAIQRESLGKCSLLLRPLPFALSSHDLPRFAGCGWAIAGQAGRQLTEFFGIGQGLWGFPLQLGCVSKALNVPGPSSERGQLWLNDGSLSGCAPSGRTPLVSYGFVNQCSSGSADHRGSAAYRCSTTSAKTLRCVSAKAVGVACLSRRTPGLFGRASRDDLGQVRKPTADVHSALAELSDRVGRLPHSRLIPHEAELRAHREFFPVSRGSN